MARYFAENNEFAEKLRQSKKEDALGNRNDAARRLASDGEG